MSRDLDWLRSESPAVADAAAHLASQFDGLAERDRRDEVVAAYRTLADASFDIDLVTDPLTPPAGIFGVGATTLQGARRPALFVLSDVVAIGTSRPSREVVAAPAEELRLLQALEASGMEVPAGTVVVGFPMPSPQSSPGAPIRCSGQRGSLGAPVALGDGSPAFLTAGHAAPDEMAAVRDEAGERVGTVVTTDHLGLHVSPERCADVAVVGDLRSLDTERPAESHEPIHRVETLKDDQEVRCRVRSGDHTGFVHSVLTSRFVLDEGGPGWGDVSLTSPISDEGDSGGPVMLAGSDAAIVGQIVGGHPSAITIVQDMGYLLSESKTELRLWA